MKATTLRAFFTALVCLSLTACSTPPAVSQAEHEIQTRLPALPFLHRGGAPSAQTQSAIQLVIQRGNFEQEHAISSGDSSGMKDTSTDSYYQQLAQDNQDMRDAGVKSIKLVSIDWGSVTVDGGSAKATTFETWQTEYSDGTTDQSRDRNVYTLVQQNGAWKIDKDDHPDDAGTSSPSAQPAASGRPAASATPAPSRSERSSSAPSSSPAVTASPGSPEAAIQQVILKGNSEQEQAIANKDSSAMKDTSTDGYYQDMAQTNQDMLDSGVTAIKLVGLQWGQVSVNGSSATASTTETWQTTYNDGSTDQVSDRNMYSLVQQDGVWKVQSDDHPDAGFIPAPGSGNPAPSGASPSPQVPPQSVAPRGRGQSANWSGYAASGGSFTEVEGTWSVPQPSTGNGALGADAAWVGIGGERSRDLIQAGTEETVLSSGRVRFDAWIEMLPQYSHPVPLPVHAGDSVTVSIKQQQPGTWAIAFKNNTTGGTYDRTVQYQSSNSSAEWIEEAPSGGRGGVMPVDNFGSITFSGASAVKDGKKVNLSEAGASPITMINGSAQPLASPSAITGDGSGFTITRTGNQPGGGGRGRRTSS